MRDFTMAKKKSTNPGAAGILSDFCAVSDSAVSDIFAISCRTFALKVEQSALGDHQIPSTDERMQLRRFLGKSAIARLESARVWWRLVGLS
jgi:hypothetical protein